MRKKQILVVFTGSMELGGIERSLIGLLGAIDYSLFDVDLFLYGHHGPLFNMIDKRVNLLPEVKELAYLRDSFKEKIRHGCFYSALCRVTDQLLSFIRPVNNDQTWAKITNKCAPKINKHYDLAISFFRPFDFIDEKVNADLKIGWIHTDYSYSKSALSGVKKDYARMEYIAAVSEQCKDAFCQKFPDLRNRVFVVENITPVDIIIDGAESVSVESEMPDDGSIKLLSIGRFCTAKNFDNIPDICRRIREKGLKVKWYLIGYGSDEALIREKIDENNVQDHVIILGKRDNPYPYIRACDLYVQPSRYEGKCVSVVEAQILQKPVVITNYGTSASQLEDGKDGIIVPIENDACASGIVKLLQDQELMENLKRNCGLKDYSNSKEVEKLYKLLEKYEDTDNYMP